MDHNVSSQSEEQSDAETVYTTHTPVMVGNRVPLNAMLDSGSMACTISEGAEIKLREVGVVTEHDQLISSRSCWLWWSSRQAKVGFQFRDGGVRQQNHGPYSGGLGQCDELILGTNVIKHILREYKQCSQVGVLWSS